MSLRVAIVTDDPGWHGRQLRRAFAARGVQSRYVSLCAARLQLESRLPVRLPGFGERLPDAVFVRGVPGGTLEQVVFHLNVLHALAALDVPVYNDGRAIERSVDKCLTSLRLRQAGLPTPPTWVCADSAAAAAVVRREASVLRPLVCKPLFGSQGVGVCLVTSPDQLPAAAAVGNVWYLQRFIGGPLVTHDGASGLPPSVSDWRIFVIAGRAVAAMRRSAAGLLANVAQGGQCHAAVLDAEPLELAQRAVGVLDMAYAGVDLMRDGQDRWWLIEVNSIPAWKGLQGVCQVDIAGCLADDLLQRCSTRLEGLAR